MKIPIPVEVKAGQCNYQDANNYCIVICAGQSWSKYLTLEIFGSNTLV